MDRFFADAADRFEDQQAVISGEAFGFVILIPVFVQVFVSAADTGRLYGKTEVSGGKVQFKTGAVFRGRFPKRPRRRTGW